MPLVDDCELDAQCCTSLFDVCQYALDQAYGALTTCYPDPLNCPLTDWRKYVTMGPGNDAIDDALTVAFVSAAPKTQGSQTLALALYQAKFEVRLRERGWPLVSVDAGGEVHPPDWQQQSNRALQALAHGEKIYRHLIWLNNQRALPPPSFRCSNAQIGVLTPLLPLGGVVGFTVPFTLDMPWSGG